MRLIKQMVCFSSIPFESLLSLIFSAIFFFILGFFFAANEARDFAENGDSREAGQLFKIASQSCEPSYYRTLDVQEKYYPESLG
jgi:hypothetical protein